MKQQLIANDCPANHGIDGCFVTRLPCEYEIKESCPDYQGYVPKTPTNRLGNPIGAFADALDNLDRGVKRDLHKTLGDAIMYGDLL